MILRSVEWSLRHPAGVVFALIILTGAGIWSALRLPIDAVPDITSPQVLVNTAVPALAPEEIEKLVTLPIESEMAGLPDMTELRSLSKFGLSQIRMTFRDHVDLYRTRQLVSERLQSVSEKIPAGLQPRLAPISTALGEIFYYTIEYRPGATNKPGTRFEQLMELTRIQEYLVSPLLKTTPGVTEVNRSGGYERQIVITPDPLRLAGIGMTVEELAAKLSENTQNVGGGLVEMGGEQVVIRAASRVDSIEEIRQIPLKFAGGAEPLLVGDIAEVKIGSSFRTGASTVDGEEAVVGGALMLAGSNSRIVARDVAQRLASLEEKLPSEMILRPLYNRSDLVNRTLRTVETNLIEGAALVMLILFALLGNFRAALIVALVIPLSMLFAVTGMVESRVSGNLMSLGAIDFGLIIDGAVVMVENIVRRLADRQRELGRALHKGERFDTILRAAREVANPTFFGVLIITVVYVPILALTGVEGKMFRPMALTVIFALVGSLVLALTLMPVLCQYFLRGFVCERDNWLVHACKGMYAPLLEFALRRRWAVMLAAMGLVAVSGVVFKRLGAEFIPELDEGTMLLQFVRSSSASLEISLDLQRKSEKLLLEKFPEIQHVFSVIGTAEIAIDPMGPNVSDTFIELKPRGTWRRIQGEIAAKEQLVELMHRELSIHVPGQALLFLQPIEMRFNEMMAGVRADIAFKVFGDDFNQLEELATTVRDLLRRVPGSGDVEFDAFGRAPLLEIKPDRAALRRYNLNAQEVNRAVATALAGGEVGTLIEGNQRVPIIVRLEEGARKDLDTLKHLPVRTEGAGLLTLGQVARVGMTEQVAAITRESARRRAAVLVNVRGRDIESFVEEALAQIRKQVKFPRGYYLELGGQFENLQTARQRLWVIVPIALAMIFSLIYMSFGSFRQAILIFVCVPLAVTGGVCALWVRQMPFTISAGVGFIALFGIAVLNGIMLISYINQLRAQGQGLREAVIEGTLTRLRPKLMTALVASVGFLPMAIATGAGAEVQRPLATVVIGGIITSTFLTLLLLPTLYEWIEREKKLDLHSKSETSPLPIQL